MYTKLLETLLSLAYIVGIHAAMLVLLTILIVLGIVSVGDSVVRVRDDGLVLLMGAASCVVAYACFRIARWIRGKGVRLIRVLGI